jgi:hypothetical protein
MRTPPSDSMTKKYKVIGINLVGESMDFPEKRRAKKKSPPGPGGLLWI